MKKAGVVTIALCLFLLLAVAPSVYADSALWTYKSDQQVQWHRLTDLGTLLVGTDDSILCLNPENGQLLWTSQDFGGAVAEMEVRGNVLL
jgi:outer membrane protein assembly factor BamB